MTSQHSTRLASDTRRDRDDGTLARRLALLVGGAFLVVGVLGFIPGITTDHGAMEIAGHESEAELLGLFQVSWLHNIVHLLFGVAGVVLSRRATWAVGYLLAGGVVYLVLAAYGFAIDHSSDANFVPVNRADDWLHVGLGIAMIGLGLLARASLADDVRSARR